MKTIHSVRIDPVEVGNRTRRVKRDVKPSLLSLLLKACNERQLCGEYGHCELDPEDRIRCKCSYFHEGELCETSLVTNDLIMPEEDEHSVSDSISDQPPTTQPNNDKDTDSWAPPLPTDCQGTRHLIIASLKRALRGSQLKSISQADKYCFRTARGAAKSGTFRAFLSSNEEDLRSIVSRTQQNLPICNANGTLVFRNFKELLNHSGKYHKEARITSFRGRDLESFPVSKIWHGSTRRGVRESAGHCDSWRHSNNFNFGRISFVGDHELLRSAVSGAMKKR